MRMLQTVPEMAKRMPKRPLGDTGMEVSVMGLGCSPLGSIFREISETEAVAIVHLAYQFGINFFDTSPFYGNTRSEEMLGKGLVGIERERIYVASKCGRYESGHDFSRETVIQSVKDSLKRLQLEYLDIVHCHDIEFVDLDIIVNEAIPALQELKKQGLIRHIGFSGLPLAIYKKILDRIPEGTVDVILSYCHYSLLDSSLEDLIPYLKEKKVGIINASILSMGLLTTAGSADWNPAPKEIKETCMKAAVAAKDQGVDLPQLAVKYSFTGNADIATHLVGCSSEEEVRNNVEAVFAAFEEPLNDKEEKVLDKVKEILKPVHNQSWPSGLPENN